MARRTPFQRASPESPTGDFQERSCQGTQLTSPVSWTRFPRPSACQQRMCQSWEAGTAAREGVAGTSVLARDSPLKLETRLGEPSRAVIQPLPTHQLLCPRLSHPGSSQTLPEEAAVSWAPSPLRSTSGACCFLSHESSPSASSEGPVAGGAFSVCLPRLAPQQEEPLGLRAVCADISPRLKNMISVKRRAVPFTDAFTASLSPNFTWGCRHRRPC